MILSCPNYKHYCLQNSGTPTVSVVAASGDVYMFHQKCLSDVQTGWSGGIPHYRDGETSDQMCHRVMKDNFAAIGVIFSEETK